LASALADGFLAAGASPGAPSRRATVTAKIFFIDEQYWVAQVWAAEPVWFAQ
jgi:hypothetical protein